METILEAAQTICIFITLLFLARIWRGLTVAYSRKCGERPRVSVLVAARNEGNELPACLRSLAAQNYPAELSEFIIIDDASSDATGRIIDDWASGDSRFKVIHLSDTDKWTMGPKKRALSEGFNQSGGEIILTTDADCTMPPQWISGMIALFDDDVGCFQQPLHYLQSKL